MTVKVLTQSQNFVLLVSDLEKNILTSQKVQEFFDDNLIGDYQYASLMYKLGKQSDVTDSNALTFFDSSCPFDLPFVKLKKATHVLN